MMAEGWRIGNDVYVAVEGPGAQARDQRLVRPVSAADPQLVGALVVRGERTCRSTRTGAKHFFLLSVIPSRSGSKQDTIGLIKVKRFLIFSPLCLRIGVIGVYICIII